VSNHPGEQRCNSCKSARLTRVGGVRCWPTPPRAHNTPQVFSLCIREYTMTYSPSDVASGRASPGLDVRAGRPPRSGGPRKVLSGTLGYRVVHFLADPTTWPNYWATPSECSYAFNFPRQSPCASLRSLRACHSPVTSPLTPRRAPRCAPQRGSPAMGSRRLANRRRVLAKALHPATIRARSSP
jgi:hypothetical protein